MSSKYQTKKDPASLKKQEEDLLDDAQYHINETETALDDAERASHAHKARTGKELDVTEENLRSGKFPEKKMD
ncbi:hypothetical protein BDB00DRAFT_933340 [Zychaea mexicana]|uniref:uncharacterized protein n=1 Tax=Zychaea mexicana TaxID=64656 RepID=UPI0022FE7B3F|nr:uncharacterized protein BDB00DRAFT_933340 [Zychaea mexicana]KAI9484913.1 hypothetical protein BDB00DRAFT_933340 [Zychaea mexicana]